VSRNQIIFTDDKDTIDFARVYAVTDSKNGLLTKIEIDKHMRENFKTAIREIFH
jgi:hypothetical protein